jgi:hypothetical protein
MAPGSHLHFKLPIVDTDFDLPAVRYGTINLANLEILRLTKTAAAIDTPILLITTAYTTSVSNTDLIL